ncbi:alpha/beta fold hydrolase [Amycolatopsis silviterrae]|uniref:Alpha/beta fold hydrolase n=1 Tax=Amycolatopsis silviterrae TaxID=1656914 RepID=A0ABW5HDW7_9PSEU
MPAYHLATDGADIVYDVQNQPVSDGVRPLLMIGQPMDASGFSALAPLFPEQTVVTYDPRGIGRSTRSDGSTENRPEVQAGDVHAVIEALGAGPVDLFASSGGAVTALALVAAYPDDVVTLVAHEPPVISALPDAAAAARACDAMTEVYLSRGWGYGMAAFIAMTSWVGEFTEEFFGLPVAEPGQFGLPAEDDGRRDDPLLSERSRPVIDYVPDVAALNAARTRVVVGVGEETGDTFTARTARGVAAQLGSGVVMFPSHHGGFLGEGSGYAGQPEAFARRLAASLQAGG